MPSSPHGLSRCSTMKHFGIFRRTEAHCANWLVSAPSLRDALVIYALDQCANARLREGRSIAVDDGYGGEIVFDHPLACIESEEKTGGEWQVRELVKGHWEAAIAEVFCSENPADVNEHIEACRPLLRWRYPRARAQAFLWHLNEGSLITFYRSRRRQSIEILGRYILPWSGWPQAQEWRGDYDDILAQLATAYPLPQRDG